MKCLSSASFIGLEKTDNDDAVYCGDRVSVVLDGASSLAEDSLSPSWFSKRIIDWFIIETVSTDGSLRDVLWNVMKKVIENVDGKYIVSRDKWASAGGVFVWDRGGFIDYAVFGDVKLVVYGDSGRVDVVYDDRLSELDGKVVMLMQEYFRRGYSIEKVKKEIRPVLVENRGLMCYGYSVLGLDLDCVDTGFYGRLNKGDVSYLLLMSDGFYRVMDFDIVSGYWELLYKILNGEYGGLIDELRKKEKDDSKMRKYPRINYSDDASFALLKIDRV